MGLPSCIGWNIVRKSNFPIEELVMTLQINTFGRVNWGFIIALVLLFAPQKIWAQESPPAHIASPEVYKVLFETDLMRVILATWQPGQKDAWHSHPPSSVFYVTDCQARVFLSDGSQAEVIRKAKRGRARDTPVKSHALQNIGDSVCQILFTELKIAN
jgi:hypothetical protein